jgi:hypothetical protein
MGMNNDTSCNNLRIGSKVIYYGDSGREESSVGKVLQFTEVPVSSFEYHGRVTRYFGALVEWPGRKAEWVSTLDLHEAQ